MVNILKSIWSCSSRSQRFFIFIAVYVVVGMIIPILKINELLPAGLVDLTMLLFQAIWAGVLLFNTKLVWRKI